MDKTQFTAWAVDRAIEVLKQEKCSEALNVTNVIDIATQFADHMKKTIKELDDYAKQLDAEIQARVDAEIAKRELAIQQAVGGEQ
jgi:hypothetical protein